MTDIFSFQPSFRPPLIEIYGCKNYREQRELLVRIDDILEKSDLDVHYQKLCLERFDKRLEYEIWRERHKDQSDLEVPDEFSSVSNWQPPYNPYSISGKVKQSWLSHTRTCLRANILRYVNQNSSLRVTSIILADSVLARWFCYINEFGPVKPPSKSTVDRYEDWVDEEAIRELIQRVIDLAAEGAPEQGVLNPLDLKTPVDLTEAWWDGTCLKANIHYPVDWVLLRDITRTLMLATILIRKRGLKTRMPEEPDHFMREMNKLVIEMTQCRRHKDSKKLRKKVLRKMLKLEKRIAKHAERHAAILGQRWLETDLSKAQADQIIGRIHGVLEQLPAAMKQARERIIGERRVCPEDKILSIYESEINVIVRGKSDAEVEFGNKLRLAEQRDGIILDYDLFREPVADNSSGPFAEGVSRIHEVTKGKLETLWTDRGMESRANIKVLEDLGIENGICPKSVETLQEKMSDPEYAKGQRRRASTEGRIGIFSNRILGGLLRSKGFDARKQSVGWAVLSHNLWVIARLDQIEEEGRQGGDPEAMARAA